MWSDIGKVEEAFISAADHNTAAVESLLNALAGAPGDPDAWPPDTRDAWQGGVEVVLDSWDRNTLSDLQVRFLFAIAAAGFDYLTLRDAIASLARRTFSSYMDPAGALDALGVHNSDVPVAEVCRRWDVFSALMPNAWCANATQGVGRIAEIDELANEVYVSFDRRQQFPLAIFLGTFAVVRPDSPLASLLSDGTGDGKTGFSVQDLLGSLVSVSLQPERALKLLAKANGLDPAEFESATPRKQAPKAAKPAGNTVVAETAATGQSRAWYDARSVAELVDLLGSTEDLGPLPEDLSGLEGLLVPAAEREDLAKEFTEALARLWNSASDCCRFVEIMRAVVDTAVCWNKVELFVSLTDGLPGRLVSGWIRASADIMGVAYLADVCTELPLRLWTYVEQVLAQFPDTDQLILQRVMKRMKDGDISADGLLWLYRSKKPEREHLANPNLLFKVLNRPVKGTFIKANRDLHKLLMENETFQKLIMKDGDTRGIEDLVRCVKRLPLLDSGERQSLLVRIVRIFPDARSLVEERQQPARKGVGRITSARSFELRRQELEDIINRRIPQNSRAIAHARSYGDLRENAEFKAAKEEQRYLTARRNELEDDLHDVKPTDFSDVRINDVVVPGCTVTLEFEGREPMVFSLLGLWDSVPELQYISYDTPVGQVLLGAHLGDRITMPNGESAVIAAIRELDNKIKAWVSDVTVTYATE